MFLSSALRMHCPRVCWKQRESGDSSGDFCEVHHYLRLLIRHGCAKAKQKVLRKQDFCEADLGYCLRRREAARPASPKPRSAKVVGSGTLVGGGVKSPRSPITPLISLSPSEISAPGPPRMMDA